MSDKVRAIVFHEHGAPDAVARVEEIALPPLASGEARVRMVAAPINPADLNVLEGKYPVRPALPGVGGMEGAGVVEAVASNVTQLAIGDLVLVPRAFGSWREKGNVCAAELRVVPRGIEALQAALLQINPPTALRMFRDFAMLESGDWVIQNAGNSGVGRAVIQIAHALGLRTISLVRRPELRDALLAEGANLVFLDDENLPGQIADANAGPIGLALNAVGGESALRLANTLAPGGTLVTYGAMGRQPVRMPNGLLIFKDLRFRGFWLNGWSDHASADEKAAMFGELFALAQRGVIHSEIEKSFPITAALEALAAAQRSGRAGKIIFEF